MATPILTILPSDSFIDAAIIELVADVTALLTASMGARPVDKDEIRFWQRQANALARAEYHWRGGVRPQLSTDAYLLPSASRPGALIHRLVKHGGVVVCGCEAGAKAQLCWHHMLVNILERAAELESAAEDEAAHRLWTRIAAARAATLETA